MTKESFSSKSVVITGASSSIGRALALRLADESAQIILKAARRREREVLMRPGRVGLWLKLLAPGLADRLVISALRKAAERTMRGTAL